MPYRPQVICTGYADSRRNLALTVIIDKFVAETLRTMIRKRNNRLFLAVIVILISIVSSVFQFHGHDCHGHVSMELLSGNITLGCSEHENHEHDGKKSEAQHPECAMHLNSAERVCQEDNGYVPDCFGSYDTVILTVPDSELLLYLKFDSFISLAFSAIDGAINHLRGSPLF